MVTKTVTPTKEKKVWTAEDTAKMDAAAVEAEKELSEMYVKGDVTGDDILKWHRKYTMTAGHKRLGRIMNTLAKTL